jgi:putative hydrolases of HD superfamily
MRTAYIGYALAKLTPNSSVERVVLLALFHDFGEARTSDHNYVHQKYGRLSEDKAIEDLSKTVPFGSEIKMLYKEQAAKETLEAKLAKDADQLEWIASLREEETKGNIKARDWIPNALARLKTEAGKNVGEQLQKTHPDEWWFNKDDKWFVDRAEEDRKWKLDDEVI